MYETFALTLTRRKQWERIGLFFYFFNKYLFISTSTTDENSARLTKKKQKEKEKERKKIKRREKIKHRENNLDPPYPDIITERPVSKQIALIKSVNNFNFNAP